MYICIYIYLYVYICIYIYIYIYIDKYGAGANFFPDQLELGNYFTY